MLTPLWMARGTSLYGWMYLFQSKRLDVGGYDSRGRIYSPTLMRPEQSDPLGLRPDINYYRWEGNGPTNQVDPSGLEWVPIKKDAPDGGRYKLYHGQWYKWDDGEQPITPVPPSAPYNPANDPFHPNFDFEDYSHRRALAICYPHHNRNFWNQTPSFEYAKKNWIQLPDWQAAEHHNGPGNEHNIKFVSPDGHFEAVFHEDGTPVTDQINAGTYNYSFDSCGGWSPSNLPHVILDWLPYKIWGNGPVFGPEDLIP